MIGNGVVNGLSNAVMCDAMDSHAQPDWNARAGVLLGLPKVAACHAHLHRQLRHLVVPPPSPCRARMISSPASRCHWSKRCNLLVDCVLEWDRIFEQASCLPHTCTPPILLACRYWRNGVWCLALKVSCAIHLVECTLQALGQPGRRRE